MKLLQKRWTPLVYLAMISCQAFSQGKFQSLFDSANACTKKEEYEKAILLLHQARALKGNDTGYNEKVYLYLGINYEYIGNKDSFTHYYLEAEKYVEYFEKKKDFGTLANLYNCLGLFKLDYLNDNEQGIKYLKKQRLYELPQTDTLSIPYCYYNIGIAFKRLNKYDSALHYFNLVKSSIYTNEPLRMHLVRQAADIYSLQENYEKALVYYNTAIQGFTALKDTNEIFNAFNNKGDCFLKQKRFAESLTCFKQAEQHITLDVNYDQKRSLYYNLAEVYEHNRNFEEAYRYQKMESNIKDSLNNQNIQEKTAEMDAFYEKQQVKDSLAISEKDRKIADDKFSISEKDRKIANDRFYGVLIGAFVICIIAFLGFRNAALRKRANKKLAAQKAKVEALADKLEEANQTKARLFSVISHDLRSPVSSLYASLKMQELKGENEKANDAVSSHIMHLLDTLEDLLTWSKSQMDRFTLQPVILRMTDVYDDLIELHQDAAAAKQITIVNKAERPVKIYTDENLLKTILRNVLANSINHTPNKSMVIVDAIADECGVMCTISNEATATDAAMLEERLQTANIGSSKHGLGNVLIKEFTEKLNADFDVNYSDGQVCINIRVPNLEKVVANKQKEVISI